MSGNRFTRLTRTQEEPDTRRLYEAAMEGVDNVLGNIRIIDAQTIQKLFAILNGLPRRVQHEVRERINQMYGVKLFPSEQATQEEIMAAQLQN